MKNVVEKQLSWFTIFMTAFYSREYFFLPRYASRVYLCRVNKRHSLDDQSGVIDGVTDTLNWQSRA